MQTRAIGENDNFVKIDNTNAVRIIVRGRQTQTFNAYLKGEGIPIINFPCEECGRELKLTENSLKELLNESKSFSSTEIDYFNTALV